ncbi:hypothetical protein PRUB_b0627 [Pseudoalteromonas rubra]|uniref:Uncharacterized protein n=1 Tax=Pseudoalteromonas rubra TaxID=43658 RepID=A0A8T0C0G2_9GAMM|nr:hypothetical protein PRUB_b0627 [Pseudoalteromonas rubra]
MRLKPLMDAASALQCELAVPSSVQSTNKTKKLTIKTH